jgi:shikimate dehydrogenase
LEKSKIQGSRFKAVSSPAVQPLLALLACPVGGNPVQYVIEKAFAHHDLDWRCVSFEVGPVDLEDAVRGLRAMGFRGAYCAAPHQQAVAGLLDRTTDTAQALGAVNVVVREGNTLLGENTEGKGIVRAVGREINPAGKRVVVLGAGAAGRAAAVELAAAGAGGLTILDAVEDRAARLAAMLSRSFGTAASAVAWRDPWPIPPETEILLSAADPTDAAENQPLPLRVESLRPELLVADTSLGTPRSWLLDQAIRRGAKTIDGLGVLVEQIAIAFERWTALEPSRPILRDAAEEFLGL